MPRIASGKRYAQAAFELALERGELDSWQRGLKQISGIVQDGKLLALLENPKLPFAAKENFLRECLGEINPLALNLSYLLVSRGRLGLAEGILHEYDKLVDAHRGIEHAEVITTLPLRDKDKKLISSRLGEMVEREVIVDVQVDPSIIGGFKAKIGDMLVDASIRHRLDLLKKSLV